MHRIMSASRFPLSQCEMLFFAYVFIAVFQKNLDDDNLFPTLQMLYYYYTCI